MLPGDWVCVFSTQQNLAPRIRMSTGPSPATPSLALPSSLETVEARVRQQGLQKGPGEEAIRVRLDHLLQLSLSFPGITQS